MRVMVFRDPERLAVGAADLIESSLAVGSSFGLAGGTTPRRTYELLRWRNVAWEGVDAFVADERWVPPDHQENNARAADEALFMHVPGRLHKVPWLPDGTPTHAASAYEATLRSIIRREEDGPRADVVLLGMGADGHTASLFPGGEAVEEKSRLFIATWVEAVGAWRLTVTLPVLHDARRVILLVSGAQKADAVRRILDESEPLPAGRLMEGSADVHWLLDDEAAAGLRRTPLVRA